MDDEGAHDHHGRNPPSQPLVQPHRHRADAHHHEVDGQEPQRPERDGLPRRPHAPQQHEVPDPRARRRAGVGEVQHHLDDGPHAHQHQRRHQQAPGPAADEVEHRVAPLAGRLVGDEVRVAAHEEEHGHDLEQPRQQPESRRPPHRAGRADDAAVPMNQRDQPMAEHDDQDARPAEEVDIAVTRGGRGFDCLVQGGRHDLNGTGSRPPRRAPSRLFHNPWGCGKGTGQAGEGRMTGSTSVAKVRRLHSASS
jgi:hypothetical protein